MKRTSAKRRAPTTTRKVSARAAVIARRTKNQVQLDGAVDDTGWTFFTNHAHVLFVLAAEGGLVLREVAHKVQITERAVQRIVRDLEQEGYLMRERVGRANTYRIRTKRPLRHAIEEHRSIGELIAWVNGP